MVIPKIVVCPVCGKRTYMRIEVGAYLKSYHIQFNCRNCRAPMKGTFNMESDSDSSGLNMENVKVEECDVDTATLTIRNADYIVEISGELPCLKPEEFDGKIRFSTPYLDSVDHIDVEKRMQQLQPVAANIEEWAKHRSMAFELLNEGSLEYIGKALQEKMGEIEYPCDNYLKSLHCLQEVVHEATKNWFVDSTQDTVIVKLLHEIEEIDRDGLHALVIESGGIEEIVANYRRATAIFSSFMDIYPDIVPAETFLSWKDKGNFCGGISTDSFNDIKNFYQDAYESILSMMYIPVCMDNILVRGDYKLFDETYAPIFAKHRYEKCKDDLARYRELDNGMRLGRLNEMEPVQRVLHVTGNRYLRNSIGHNNYYYDRINQEMSIYDQKNPKKVKLKKSLMELAVDCFELVKTATMLGEVMLFILRQEEWHNGIHSIMHPRFYTGLERNSKCPCGSNKKYKKCCKNDIDKYVIYKK